MKKLVSFKLFESIQSYDFRRISDDEYLFEDEFSNFFKVEFKKIYDDLVEVIYLVKEGDSWTYKEVKTNIFKTTQTVIDDILTQYLDNNEWVDMVLIKGLSKVNEKDFISKRTKWYMRYLENNPINGWSMERDGNSIYLFKN